MTAEGDLSRSPSGGVDSTACSIRTLDKARAERHSRRLLDIHNSIPHVTWNRDDLLADRSGDREFTDKWQHSSVVIDHSSHQPVGLMVAYVREPWAAFPDRSLYLHRGAILDGYRRNGLGRMLFERYTRPAARPAALEWLTLQTNAEPSNEWVVRFYEDLGFQRGELVVYADKTDYLMHQRWI